MGERLSDILTREKFLNVNRQEIAEVVHQRGLPKCVAIMLDGTRRVLKLEPNFHDDRWLYYEDNITGLINKSIETADILFDFGVKDIIGPLASIGNLNRKDFMPAGLDRLLKPLTSEYVQSVLEKQNASISFYGDLNYARSMNGGELIDKYLDSFKKINSKKPSKHILLGIGFSTERETAIIAKQAINYYIKFGRVPSYEDLVTGYFGFNVSPIDIFIRTNEIKASGGMTPLLIQPDTQLYFFVSPGIMSISEKTLRKIFYDYLFSRVLSHGTHEHESISEEEAAIIRKFYIDHKDEILGVGRRVGDIWIHDPGNK